MNRAQKTLMVVLPLMVVLGASTAVASDFTVGRILAAASSITAAVAFVMMLWEARKPGGGRLSADG